MTTSPQPIASPPRLATWLASVRVSSERREFVLGDLDEEFAQLVRTRDLLTARRWYWRQAWRCFLSRSPRVFQDPTPSRERPAMSHTMQDLRFAVRLLRRSPGFTAVVLLTLALGIGATTTIFSVVYAVLLKPLPFPDPDRLVVVLNGSTLAEGVPTSYPEYLEMRDARALSQVATYFNWGATLTGGGSPDQLYGVRASASLFPLLSVQPVIGRVFNEAEETRAAERVVLISESLWSRRFSRDPGVIGRSIVLNDQPFTIIGVLPASFRSVRPSDATRANRDRDIWAPLRLTEETAPRSLNFMFVIGRLAPGQMLTQAHDALLAAIKPKAMSSNPHLFVGPVRQSLVADSRQVLLTLFGAVGCVLLITCANLANLLLAQASGRRQEIGMRLALGASRARVFRQLLTESVLIALTGGMLGLALAKLGVVAFAQSDIVARAGAYSLSLDWQVLGFALALSVTCGLLVGVIPAAQVGRLGVKTGQRDGTRSTTGGTGLRGILVVAEVALTLILLVGAGLLARSFANLVFVPRGFDASQVVTFDIDASATKYPKPPDQARFFDDVLARLRGLPGVAGAAIVNALPLDGDDVNGTTPVEGQTYLPDTAPVAEKRIISPDYFHVMGIAIRRGRDFTDRDNASSPGVAILNEAYVRRYLADDDPLRHRVGFNWDMDGWQQVIGIVADVKQYGLDDPPTPMIYVSYRQRPTDAASAAVKSPNSLVALSPAIRRAIWSIDPDRPVSRLRTMSTVVSESLATWRLTMGLAAAFALLGLVLAATGIAGVMSGATQQRTREFGIRLALGATPREILRLALGRGVWLTLLGVGLGIGGALGITRVMANRLFQVTPTDPATIAAVSAGLALVALVATYVPSRRAVRIDPASALRNN